MGTQGTIGRRLHLVCVTVLSLLLFILSPSAALQAWAQVDFHRGWKASGDPCYPVKQEKRWLKQKYKVNTAYLSCIPVKFTVTWKLTESYHRHGRYGVDRAKLELQETFDGYLRIERSHKKPRKVRRFILQGPAPCCPGVIKSQLLAAQATVLGCTAFGEECRQFSTDGTTIPFNVVPESHGCSFTWTADGMGTEGNCGSASVHLRDGVVRRPYSKRPGILETLKGGSFNLEVKGPAGFTWADILLGMEQGVISKDFPINEKMVIPGTPEVHTLAGTVTVKVEFGEQEDEHWQITVTARERTMAGPPLKARPPGKTYVTVAVWGNFAWQLTGSFVIQRSKKTWSYKSGRITAASINSWIKLSRDDLYQCWTKCKKDPPQGGQALVDAYLDGKRVGSGVKISWPSFRAEVCALCMPLRAYMAKKPYRHRFGSGELMLKLSGLTLPLKDGHRQKGKVSDWMTYTVTLRRLK